MIGSIGQGRENTKQFMTLRLMKKRSDLFVALTSSQLLVYDLKGNSLPPIPLCLRVPKGKIHVQDSNLIAAVLLPFPGFHRYCLDTGFPGRKKSIHRTGDRTVL